MSIRLTNLCPMLVLTFLLNGARVVPENVVSLSIFAFGSRGGFVVEGVLVSTFVKCFLVRRGGFVE